MKSWIIIGITLLLYACTQEQKKNKIPEIKKADQDEIEKIAPQKEIIQYDFSSVPKDTLFVSGKHIIFSKPSAQEFEIIKDEEGINEVDADFDFYASKVADSLKETYAVSISDKRIIGIVRLSDTIYFDRLTSKSKYHKGPINYGAIFVFNNYFTIYPNVFNDFSYYGLINDYYDNIRYEIPIEFKYVTSKNGLNIRKENGQTDGKFDFGDLVHIIDYSDDSIEVSDQGKTIKDCWAIIKWHDRGSTKKRYVFNGFLGEASDVKVYKDQLCIGYQLEKKDSYGNDYDYLECLKQYFDFKLISEQEYQSLEAFGEDHISINPLVKVEKNENQTENITLPLRDSSLFIKSEVDYSRSSHYYLGDFDFLNQYLLYNIYYKAEEALYSLLDRDNGKESFYFWGYPNISPNKKRIICFSHDIYEDLFYFNIYKINEDQSIQKEYSFNFIHWINVGRDKVKWLSNEEFVITIVHQKVWRGQNIEKPQYLKIKLKN